MVNLLINFRQSAVVSISMSFFEENLKKKWTISLSSRSIAVSVHLFNRTPRR
jgi:hypothetical protein